MSAQPPPLSMDAPPLRDTLRSPPVTAHPAIHPGMTDDEIRAVLQAMPYFEHARFVQSNGIAGFHIPEVAWFRHCEFGTSLDQYARRYVDDGAHEVPFQSEAIHGFARHIAFCLLWLVAGVVLGRAGHPILSLAAMAIFAWLLVGACNYHREVCTDGC